MKILCNLPLECFEPRDRLGIELVTYGPRERMWVDGTHYPFDVEFDPSTGTIEELLARLPRGFTPDFLWIWWPDQEPLPRGLERCPIPVVGTMSDWNLTLPYVVGLWPFFDAWLVDRAGVPLFERLSFAGVRWFCQYTFKAPFHRIYPDEQRTLDVAFAGNLNPIVQSERAPWLERVRRLAERGLQVEVTSGVHGEAYGRLLSRSKLGFNRAIRGEMNLRAFEVPACGAVLLIERENLEVREFFVPGEECVLYGDDDFEAVVQGLLADPTRLQRIAAAGHARVQDYRLGRKLAALPSLLAGLRRERPQATPAECALGRGTALLATWAPGPVTTRALVEAADLAPEDPRALNALALAWLKTAGLGEAQRAADLLARACTVSPSYLPAVRNLVVLCAANGRPDLANGWRSELEERSAEAGDWRDFDGPVLPLGFTREGIALSHALAQAIARDDRELLAHAWCA